MKAPEKIYVLNHKDYSDRRILNAFTEREDNSDIEYTRTDAFIEKACEWLKKNVTYTHPRKGTEECVVNLNAFIEAMKGGNNA